MFNTNELQELIREGVIGVQKHPGHELYIYNYTAKAQYDRVWNEITLQCRGLILDGDGNVVARPFKKFFNLGEMENQIIPQEPFEVFDKLDGSLGILYWVGDEAFIATRGSFTSKQSVRANEILKSKYRDVVAGLDRNNTYLFEIIYPENRIVIDYGDMEDLILLGVISNETGLEHAPEGWGFTPVTRYDGLTDIQSLKELQEDNREGFVIRFRSGLRYKVKFEEYIRIHRIVSNVSNISIWEYLKSGKGLDEVLDRVPDEFYDWVKKTNREMTDAYRRIEEQARKEMRMLETRKETAIYFMSCKYPSVMFAMLDERKYDEIIWKMLRPEYSKPYMNAE